ncbi:chorismate--pyruvate lyase family protein [Testudinibacter sp. P80/BLE/0925]|uniref:chorismate--pyruvate lyase family protein n=1 Tax=Testudinibacter sp. TW-1 TaxID=3417757 RepID=UPI003D359CA5
MPKQKIIPGYRTWLQSAVWQQGATALSATEQEWLLCAESLTAKLKRHCKLFQVELLHQGWQNELFSNESAVLAKNQRYWLREVFLYGDQQPWLFARTVIPEQLCIQFPPLLALGDKPLGEFLFEQKFVRGELEWSKMDGLAARRSVFSMQDSWLLVSELFLDDFGYL